MPLSRARSVQAGAQNAGLSKCCRFHAFSCCVSGSPHALLFSPLVLATQPLKIVILKKATRHARNNHRFNELLNKYGNIDKAILGIQFSVWLLFHEGSLEDGEKQTLKLI